jgi:hypothetical protein
MLIGAHNWGFTLDSITALTIHLWHGAPDKQIPITQAQAIAAELAHCEPTLYPDDAHISTIANHADEIVAALVAIDPPTSGVALRHSSCRCRALHTCANPRIAGGPTRYEASELPPPR